MTNSKTFRLMTYNVHSCIGTDGQLSHNRIAEVIAQFSPDIVALQELDVGKARSGRIDQAEAIAQQLKMKFHFHPAIQREEEKYGDAVLSRFPMRLVRSGKLPTLPQRPRLQPRGALWTTVRVDDTELQVINTHMGLRRRERRVQAEAVLGPEWLADPECRPPVVLCGDFNSLPGGGVIRRLQRKFRDAQRCLHGRRPQKTFSTVYPVFRIDHVFISPELIVESVQVPRTPLTRVASDHLPLIVQMRLP